MPKSAGQALALNEAHWRSEMRHRHSRLASRRRRAYSACLALIRALEAIDGKIPDPWAAPTRPPEKPSDAARAIPRDPGKPSTR